LQNLHNYGMIKNITY